MKRGETSSGQVPAACDARRLRLRGTADQRVSPPKLLLFCSRSMKHLARSCDPRSTVSMPPKP